MTITSLRYPKTALCVCLGLIPLLSCSKDSDDDNKDEPSDPTAGYPTVTLTGLGEASQAFSFGKGTIDASVMKFTVFKFAVSESADCSSPIEVFSNDAGVAKDMLTNPTFGAGRLKPGTYPCVLIEVSKIISAAPAKDDGACVKDTVLADVICGDGQQSEKIDGTAVTCNASSTDAQHVTLFITTLSPGSTGARALQKPTSASDTTSGIKLTSPLVISADKSVTFVVDHTNFFQPYSVGGQSGCGTSAPSFSFK